MHRTAIIGSSDLAKHMLYYLVKENYEIVGYFDDYKSVNTKILGYNVLGKIKEAPKFSKELDVIFIGIGYNFLKEKSLISEFIIKNNLKIGNYIHQSVYADTSAIINKGAFILPNCTLDKNVKIGNNVFINPNCCVSHDSEIENETFLGPGVIISGKSKIGKRCFIGAGSVIIDNIQISDEVTVGAGSVVTKNIFEKGIYVGIPAKKIIKIK